MTHFHFNKDVENNEKITRQLLKLYYIRILYYLFIYLLIYLISLSRHHMLNVKST